DSEFPCPRKQQPAGNSECSYYCEMNGQWKLGKFQNGARCDYNAVKDGVCNEGLCYASGDSASNTQNQGGSRRQENEDQGDDEWDRK
uniref:BaSO(4)-adsorbing protein 1 n=1 Tax=Ornithodoros savignyi TaxID=69826 RepID=BSAP1_ORNSA|nr:Chain A, tick salivary protein BSAP1 [Ornithodoros savignyi]